MGKNRKVFRALTQLKAEKFSKCDRKIQLVNSGKSMDFK